MRTVQLGQFTNEHANAIAEKLEHAGITWWFKQPGFLSRMWEHGTRLFVDEARLEEARTLAQQALEQAAGPTEP